MLSSQFKFWMAVGSGVIVSSIYVYRTDFGGEWGILWTNAVLVAICAIVFVHCKRIKKKIGRIIEEHLRDKVLER